MLLRRRVSNDRVPTTFRVESIRFLRSQGLNCPATGVASMHVWLLLLRLALTVSAAYGALLSGVGLLFCISMSTGPNEPVDPRFVLYMLFLFGAPLLFFLGSIVTAWLPGRGRFILLTGIALHLLSL